MKKIFSLLGAALLAVSCGNDSSVATINGDLEGMSADDSVVVFYNGLKDTIAAADGKFHYEYTDSLASIVRIIKLAKGENAPRVRPVTVMMFPGVSVDVMGDFNDNEVSGGDFYDEYNAMYKEVKDIDAERKAINAQYMDLMNKRAAREDILRSFEDLKVVDGKYQAHLERYISGHLNSPVSLFLLCNVHPKYGKKYIADFTPAVKEGPMRRMYASTLAYYERIMVKEQAAQNIKEGNAAPDFTAKDINGNEFQLSSLQGKYVVLDFWGSWCGWCIADFPKMKELYNKYNGKFEIVSIDCKDSEEAWKKAVEKHGLKWVNVINPEDDFRKDLITKYNITGYPTKIVISPDGRILDIFLGEREEFYSAMRMYLK